MAAAAEGGFGPIGLKSTPSTPIVEWGGGTPHQPKGFEVKRTLFVIAAIVALFAGACSSTEEQFRDSLIEDGFTEEQADCTLEGLEDAGIDPADLTDDALGDAEPPAEAVEITAACFLGLSLDEMQETIDDADSGSLTDPAIDDYGDDAALDALFDSCRDGDGAACDELYFTSPFGSRYEAYGNTCGGRFTDNPPLSCADEMG